MAVVEFHVDVCNCMGANMVNTLLEQIAPSIGLLTKSRVGIKILTNLNIERRAGARF